MQKWKTAIARILYPGKFLTWLIPLAGFSLLGLVFGKGWENTPLAYASYVLAFYSLVLLILESVPAIGKAKALYRKFAQRNPYRLKTTLRKSLAIPVCYGSFLLLSGIYYRSVWFFSNGIYYFMLSLIRLSLLRCAAKQSACEAEAQKQIIGWEGFRTCGILMLLLNLAMSGMVFQMIWQGQGSRYHEFTVYAVAAYTFYRLTMSIFRVIQKKGKHDPLEGAARNINLTAAMMSLYSLQVAMLNVFGHDDRYALLMNQLSGSGVCLLVVLGALGMTVYGTVRKQALTAETAHSSAKRGR